MGRPPRHVSSTPTTTPTGAAVPQKEKRMKPAIALTSVFLAVSVGSLAACSEDKPAVCTSVDDLKASVEDVKDIDVQDSSALTDLKSGLTAIQGDLDAVKADAKSEFSSQLDAVETSYTAVQTGVEAATADPTAATLSTAASALSTFSTDVQTLISDVQSTC